MREYFNLAATTPFHLLGIQKTPWWLIGLVLAGAIVSRTAVFFWMMWRRKKD